MGSGEDMVSMQEAADILGVCNATFRSWHQRGLIKGYPEKHSGAGGIKLWFRKDEVQLLGEFFSEDVTLSKIADLALRASMRARRAEEMVETLTSYLGFSTEHFDDSKEGILRDYLRAQEIIKGRMTNREDDLFWAKRLISLNEEYLRAVRHYTGDSTPWKVYIDAAKHLLVQYNSRLSPNRVILEHAVRNVRHAAFLFACDEQGLKKARKMFPGESYTDTLARMILAD